jgi:hypothetical protein
MGAKTIYSRSKEELVSKCNRIIGEMIEEKISIERKDGYKEIMTKMRNN